MVYTWYINTCRKLQWVKQIRLARTLIEMLNPPSLYLSVAALHWESSSELEHKSKIKTAETHTDHTGALSQSQFFSPAYLQCCIIFFQILIEVIVTRFWKDHHEESSTHLYLSSSHQSICCHPVVHWDSSWNTLLDQKLMMEIAIDAIDGQMDIATD